MGYFLGIDGGQSHTTALIADGRGNILGVGHAGASNHTRAPGGRERLTNAVNQSVSEALQQADLLAGGTVADFAFDSAHLAMTGEPEEKVEIVKELLRAEVLRVAHDAPAALVGAHLGGVGIIVLAGTGSVACGEADDPKLGRQFARVGGRGYLFADEGSAFAIARQAVSKAMRRVDQTERQNKLQVALLKHFKRPSIEQLIADFYAEDISRDELAAFASHMDVLAARGDDMAQEILDQAAADLAELALLTWRRLRTKVALDVAYGGGVFKSQRVFTRFVDGVVKLLPGSRVVAPQAGPEVGALLLAYRQAEVQITPSLLANLKNSTLAKETP